MGFYVYFLYIYIYIYLLYIKIDGFLRLYNRTRNLVLLSGITYVISHNYAIIKVGSYDSLTLEKTLTFYIIILIKSAFSKAKNNYHYKILLETCSYK